MKQNVLFKINNVMKNVIHVMKLEIILKINVKVVNMDMKNLILIVLYVIKIKNIFIMIL
jgi:hypothetical protein